MSNNFKPISKTQFPSIPSCYPFHDDGDFFTWGNYWFQLRRKSFPALANSPQDAPIIYHYTLVAFERRDANPQASSLPIAIVAIEQMNMDCPNNAHMLKLFGKDAPMMLGLFFNGKRENLGEYPKSEINNTDNVIRTLFSIMAERLAPSGKLRLIGNFEQANADPDSGLPYRSTSTKITNNSSKSSNLVIWILLIITAIVIFLNIT